MFVRYIRDWLEGNTSNTGSHWVQIAAWDANRANMTLTDASSNRAYLKTCTSTDSGGSNRTVAQVVDGDIASTRYFGGAVTGTPVYVQVDLGAAYDIDYVQVWHYYTDARTYFQHRVEVSYDGIVWRQAQQPEGNAKESATGTYYLLMEDLTGAFTYRSVQVEIQDGIGKAIVKRGGATPSFTTIPSVASPVPANILQEIRVAIQAIISATAISVATDHLILSEWPDTRDDYYNVNSGAGSCTSGCTFICEVNCTGYCGSGCSGNCNTSCTSSCGGACSAGGACSGSACTTSCYANCQSNCSCIFSSSCGSGCSYRCSGSCRASCGGQCSGACGSACAGSTCGNVCGRLCGAVCSQGCENSCSSYTNLL